MDADAIRRTTVLLLALLQLAMPILAFRGGFDTFVQRPPMQVEPNPATPAGYGFIIWPVIYAASIALAIYQLLPGVAENAVMRRIGWPVAGGYALCILWVAAARFGPLLGTVPIIWLMLLCLGWSFAIAAQPAEDITQERWGHQVFIVSPLALYAGWLSIAAFVNSADVLPGYGVSRLGLSAQLWGVVVVSVVSAFAVLMIYVSSAHLVYVATVIWALVAVIVRNGASEQSLWVSVSAGLATALVLGISVVTWSR